MGFFHAGQANVQTTETVTEAGMVDAQTMQQGGVKISQVDGLLGNVVGEVVGATLFNAPFNAAACHPAGKAAAMMVAAGTGVAESALAEGGAAKFGHKQHQRIFQ